MTREQKIRRAQRADRSQIINRFGVLPAPGAVKVVEHLDGFHLHHDGEELLPWRAFPDRRKAWDWYHAIINGPASADVIRLPSQQSPA